MNYLEKHINKIVKQDLFLKDLKKNTNCLPKIEKIVLSSKFIGVNKLSIVSMFEILTYHKPYLCKSRVNLLSLSLRKGDPVGIKLILRKKVMYDFLMYFLFEILPSTKKLNKIKLNNQSIQWHIKDIYHLEETSYLYMYLSELTSFDLVIYGKNLNKNFFTAIRFPILIN